MHGKRGTDTSIDELLRNAKYIRALLSGYSINSPGSKYKNSLGRARMNFCIDFSSALELFPPSNSYYVLVQHFYDVYSGTIEIKKKKKRKKGRKNE